MIRIVKLQPMPGTVDITSAMGEMLATVKQTCEPMGDEAFELWVNDSMPFGIEQAEALIAAWESDVEVARELHEYRKRRPRRRRGGRQRPRRAD